MASEDWKEVTPREPCPICGKSNWCGQSADRSAVICMRIKQPGCRKETKNGGYLYVIGDINPLAKPDYRQRVSLNTRDIKPAKDFSELASKFQRQVNPLHLKRFATKLGVCTESLQSLGVGYDTEKKCWAFPMHDARGVVRGIRLRRSNGFQFAVKESKQGLFIPSDVLAKSEVETLHVTEGASDSAALIAVGFPDVVGLPSAKNAFHLVVDLAKKLTPCEVVIWADRDAVGRDSANKLCSKLLGFVPTVRVVLPPQQAKDVRAALTAGASKEDFERQIEQAKTRRLKVRIR